MTCETARAAIIDARTGNLSGAERGALDAHLAACASCRAEAGALDALWSDLALVRTPPMRPDAGSRLEAAVASGVRSARTPANGGRHARVLLQAAVLVLVAGAAWFWGRFSAANDAPGAPRAVDVATSEPEFLLLLIGEGTPTTDSIAARGVVDEYRRWAAGLARAGRLVNAEKLRDDAGRTLGGEVVARTDEDRVTGFFVIRARDFDDAVRIANQSPHLRRGGRVELRAIEGT